MFLSSLFNFSRSKPTFIFVGHSHIGALKQATLKSRDLPQSSMFFNCLHDLKDKPLIGQSENGDASLNEYILQGLHDAVDKSHSPIIFSLLGGNEHNKISLLEHPEPFYFLMPGENPAEETIDSQRVFIPYRQMYDIMYSRTNFFFDVLDLIRKEFSVPIYHIESPPPIGSDSHIIKHLDPYFEKQERSNLISSRQLRKRMWRLSSQTYIDHCVKSDIPFIPAPASSLDCEGFLDPKGYPNDATHGNSWYGEEVITDLVRRFPK